MLLATLGILPFNGPARRRVDCRSDARLNGAFRRLPLALAENTEDDKRDCDLIEFPQRLNFEGGEG